MIKKTPKLCREARQTFETWRNAWKTNIDQYHYFHNFTLGQQWDDDEEDMLRNYKKVPMQVNKCGTLLNIMLGEQQQNTPQLQVFPEENCDEEAAHIRELIVKQIVLGNAAKTVYQQVADQAFTGGYSAYFIGADYIHPKSFDQDFVWKSFKDPTKCYWSLDAEDVNKTDSMEAGWVARMSRKKFRALHGAKIEEKIFDETNPIAASREEVANITQPGTNDSFIWSDENCVTIQYHLKKVPYTETLYKLSNGRSVTQKEMDEIVEKSKKIREEKLIELRIQQALSHQLEIANAQQDLLMPQDPNMGAGQYDPLLGQHLQQPTNPIPASEPSQQDLFNDHPDILTLYDDQEIVRIEDEKDATCYKIKFYELCGEYTLKETTVTSEQMPLIFVDQRSYFDKEGNQICRPFLIDIKDTQKYINYLATQSAYVLKVSRYDQWIGSKKNVQSQSTQQQWRDPLSLQGMLTYDESPSGAKPERINPPELSQSLLTQYERAIEDLYTSTGLTPTRMGQSGNEISGDAIDSRTRQGSYATYVASNSINRAIAKGGEVVNEMIPHIYDTMRVIALMTPDEGMKNITINQQMDEYGERIKNDIRKGTFRVRLLPGPSYEGQKEQALVSLNAAIQANPDVFPLIADLYAENLPLANTIELRNRLKTMVPPQVIEAGKSGKSPKPVQQPPSPQQIEAQYKQQMLALKSQEIGIRKQELALKAQQQDSDTKIEMTKLQQAQQQIEDEMIHEQMTYLAEMNKTNSAEHIAHANNFAKILTHTQPQKGENHGSHI